MISPHLSCQWYWQSLLMISLPFLPGPIFMFSSAQSTCFSWWTNPHQFDPSKSFCSFNLHSISILGVKSRICFWSVFWSMISSIFNLSGLNPVSPFELGWPSPDFRINVTGWKWIPQLFPCHGPPKTDLGGRCHNRMGHCSQGLARIWWKQRPKLWFLQSSHAWYRIPGAKLRQTTC